MTPPRDPWPLWQRTLFRFFCVYLLLQTAPWDWFSEIPGIATLSAAVNWGIDQAVRAANAHLFHVRETLVPPNGSGDTSWAWTHLWLMLSIAALACAVWSVIDRKRQGYWRLVWWFRTLVRYYVASYALSYGIIKLFLLQMTFPSLTQMSTPLGDLLPMRLSWLFLGYSSHYQFFSGAMETVAGLLLLNRRTVTLGLIAAAGAFLNVVMINLSYDVPVKLFSMHLLLSCLVLLAMDAPRLAPFFLLNLAVPATTAWEPVHTRPWQHYTRRAAKGLFVVVLLVMPLWRAWQTYRAQQLPRAAVPFGAAIYDVKHYVLNGDTIPPSSADSLRWRDVIFDNAMQGSVNTRDTLFWQRYRRGVFRYKADTATHTVAVWRTSFLLDSTYLFTWRYEQPDSSTVRLWSALRRDSLYVELTRSTRHFQLAERQFHWLSEYNR